MGDGTKKRQLVGMLNSERPPGRPIGMCFFMENGDKDTSYVCKMSEIEIHTTQKRSEIRVIDTK